MKKKILPGLSLLFMFSACLSLLNAMNNGPMFRIVDFTDILFKISISLALALYCAKTGLSSQPEFARTKNGKRDLASEKIEMPIQVPKISFNDVAGLDEVKEELAEIIDFLKNPERYRKMGARLPKGVLFYGPPGTGKTLLAKAIASESNASFNFACGSEFVEKYVGVGAKRVRTLFEKAKKEAPGVIFIDEIDAIGAKRTTESNNEKDQTLNQLLVEMDGYDTSESVIVVAATNRLDLLDEALLRPGRFDRQIYVGNPDLKVREEILKVHFKNKPLDSAVVMKNIAKKTPGMSGAHLASIANEAAILAVRHRKTIISNEEIDKAIEKIVAGLERKGSIISDIEKKKVAFHEAGHAVLAKYLGRDTVHKISIIPRGKALGYIMQIPDEDKFLLTADEIKDKIKILFGGRIAEQIIFNELSSGARDDLKRANGWAYEMVCELGMSSLGNIVYDEASIKNCFSEVNGEIKNILDECYDIAYKILSGNLDVLHAIADALIEKETLHEDEVDEIACSVNPDFPSEKKLAL